MKVKTNSGGEITPKVIEWLHQCFLVTESGRPLQPDPFYERNKVLTQDVVDAVIASIEELMVNELKKYPGYHRSAQGISPSEYLIPTGFDKLPQTEKLALVQGIDRIFQKYRDDASDPKPEPKPVDGRPMPDMMDWY